MLQRCCWKEGANLSLVVSGKIYTSTKIIDGSILIENGKIARIGKNLEGEEKLDFRRKGNLILPGLIDMHVHLRDFKLDYKEDFETGTMAAAMGGFTVVCDMPNTIPPINKPSVLRKREKIARKKSFVDYGLYYGVPKKLEHLTEEVVDLAIGLKIFMHREFYSQENQELMRKTLDFASRKNMLVVAHAERPEPVRHTEFGPIRLPEAEAGAIEDITELSSKVGFKLHVTHISSTRGAEIFSKKKSLLPLTGDTCPHYLLLTEKDVEKIGKIARVEPSLRSERDRKFLLEKLQKGVIDCVTSDHAPHSLEEKLADPPASGFPSLETTVPLLLTMVKKDMLRLEDFVRTCSSKPARILGLKHLGEIKEGMTANLTVVDLEKEWKIDPSNFISKAKFSPFAGTKVIGVPIATLVRGKLVMFEREIVGRRGWGRNVKTFG
ncbi:MAG: dihydroorotase family protein [Candidatus Hadarchaeales archaeon]